MNSWDKPITRRDIAELVVGSTLVAAVLVLLQHLGMNRWHSVVLVVFCGAIGRGVLWPKVTRTMSRRKSN